MKYQKSLILIDYFVVDFFNLLEIQMDCLVILLLFFSCLSRKSKYLSVNIVSDFITIPDLGLYFSHILLHKPMVAATSNMSHDMRFSFIKLY